MTAALDAHRRLPAPRRWQRNLVFATIGLAVVTGWIGDALWASLVDRHPVVLLLLNAKPRYLILTVNQIDTWLFYPLGTFRLAFTKPLVWLVGAWYGQRAVTWAENRSAKGGKAIRWLEGHFSRFGWLAVAVIPNNVVCLFAGSAGFSLGLFMLVAIAGTLVRLWLVTLLGAALTDQIDVVIEWVVAHRALIVALSIAVVLGGLLWQRRNGGTSLDDLASLEAATEDEGLGEGEPR